MLHTGNAFVHEVLFASFWLINPFQKWTIHRINPTCPPASLVLSKIINALKGHRFADIPDIQQNVTLLLGIPGKGFQDCFCLWGTIIRVHSFTRRVFLR
jgi:hypothetical protein